MPQNPRPFPAHKIPDDALRAAFGDLGKACDKLAELRQAWALEDNAAKSESAHGLILGAVVELLALSGPAGGAAMARAIGAAEAAGFQVAFNPGSLSVYRNTAASGQTL